jgi:hypothetical protein
MPVPQLPQTVASAGAAEQKRVPQLPQTVASAGATEQKRVPQLPPITQGAGDIVEMPEALQKLETQNCHIEDFAPKYVDRPKVPINNENIDIVNYGDNEGEGDPFDVVEQKYYDDPIKTDENKNQKTYGYHSSLWTFNNHEENRLRLINANRATTERVVPAKILHVEPLEKQHAYICLNKAKSGLEGGFRKFNEIVQITAKNNKFLRNAKYYSDLYESEDITTSGDAFVKLQPTTLGRQKTVGGDLKITNTYNYNFRNGNTTLNYPSANTEGELLVGLTKEERGYAETLVTKDYGTWSEKDKNLYDRIKQEVQGQIPWMRQWQDNRPKKSINHQLASYDFDHVKHFLLNSEDVNHSNLDAKMQEYTRGNVDDINQQIKQLVDNFNKGADELLATSKQQQLELKQKSEELQRETEELNKRITEYNRLRMGINTNNKDEINRQRQEIERKKSEVQRKTQEYDNSVTAYNNTLQNNVASQSQKKLEIEQKIRYYTTAVKQGYQGLSKINDHMSKTTTILAIANRMATECALKIKKILADPKICEEIYREFVRDNRDYINDELRDMRNVMSAGQNKTLRENILRATQLTKGEFVHSCLLNKNGKDERAKLPGLRFGFNKAAYEYAGIVHAAKDYTEWKSLKTTEVADAYNESLKIYSNIFKSVESIGELEQQKSILSIAQTEINYKKDTEKGKKHIVLMSIIEAIVYRLIMQHANNIFSPDYVRKWYYELMLNIAEYVKKHGLDEFLAIAHNDQSQMHGSGKDAALAAFGQYANAMKNVAKMLNCVIDAPQSKDTYKIEYAEGILRDAKKYAKYHGCRLFNKQIDDNVLQDASNTLRSCIKSAKARKDGDSELVGDQFSQKLQNIILSTFRTTADSQKKTYGTKNMDISGIEIGTNIGKSIATALGKSVNNTENDDQKKLLMVVVDFFKMATFSYNSKGGLEYMPTTIEDIHNRKKLAGQVRPKIIHFEFPYEKLLRNKKPKFNINALKKSIRTYIKKNGLLPSEKNNDGFDFVLNKFLEIENRTVGTYNREIENGNERPTKIRSTIIGKRHNKPINGNGIGTNVTTSGRIRHIVKNLYKNSRYGRKISKKYKNKITSPDDTYPVPY